MSLSRPKSRSKAPSSPPASIPEDEDDLPKHKPPPDDLQKRSFSIDTSDRTYNLRAESTVVMTQWVQAIRAEKKAYGRQLDLSRHSALFSSGLKIPVGEQYLQHVVEQDDARRFRDESIKKCIQWSKTNLIDEYPRYITHEATATDIAVDDVNTTTCFAMIRMVNTIGVDSLKIGYKANDTVSTVLGDAIAKWSRKNTIRADASSTDYMFKVTGCNDFLYGHDLMLHYDYVRHTINHHRTADLVLQRKPSALIQRVDEVRPAAVASAGSFEEGEPGDEKVKGGVNNYIPLHQLTSNFGFRLLCARQLSLDSPSFSRARAMAEAAGAGLCCRVESKLALGADVLCEPHWTDPVAGRLSVKFDVWVEMPVPTCNLPRGTKLCITLYGGVSSTRVQVPLAWINVQLFDHKGVLKSGIMTFKMWLNDTASPLATCQQNTDLSRSPASIELAFPTPAGDQPVIWASVPESQLTPGQLTRIRSHTNSSKVDKLLGTDNVTASKASKLLGKGGGNQSEMQRLAEADMLYDLTDKDKNTLWQRRDQCQNAPTTLPKLLRAVNWTRREDVIEMRRLLRTWPRLEVRDAIELLDAKYADDMVRHFAVRCLDGVPDGVLQEILPQLVQAIKHEPYHTSHLARFLFSRALHSSHRIGHDFFWQLKAEMHNVAIRERYGVLVSSYLEGCPPKLQQQYFDTSDIIKSLIGISKSVKTLPKNQRTDTLRQFLASLKLPEQFSLPLSSRMVAKSFRVEKCRVMTSATAPLWLVLENTDPHGNDIFIIFKAGDDLRQDILTLQMFQIMDRIWCENGLDLGMTTYKCVAVDQEVGLVEVVLNAETVGDISRQSGNTKLGSVMAAFKSSPLIDWLRGHNPSDEDFLKAQDNFCRSCAAYCVATYVLGIGDRHNDNVMITVRGSLFHIDFGHFLGNFQRFLGMNRDRAPFVFTPDFAHVLGGRDSEQFNRFVQYSVGAYNIIRKNSRVFINLFGLMLSTGITELSSPQDLDFMRHTLALGKSDEEAGQEFRKLIDKSLSTKATQLNNAVHLLAN